MRSIDLTLFLKLAVLSLVSILGFLVLDIRAEKYINFEPIGVGNEK